MGKGEVNPNLGLVCKPLPNAGPMIVMVKSKPGIFRDVNGEIVPDEMAVEAGFDVKALKRTAAMAEAKAVALAGIEAKFAKESKVIDGLSDEELLGNGDADKGGNDDDEPFVATNSSGEPRSARLVKGGPVRSIEYDNTSENRGWKLCDRDTGEVFASRLEKEVAQERLLAPETASGALI